jgi:aldose 1-epimerase
MRSILLRDDDWLVRVLPLRGSLASCAFRGQAIFKPVPQAPFGDAPAADVCYFPLVPFANRIANSRFAFDGRTVELRPNIADHPHALHGHGWQAEWHVVESGRTACALVYEHVAVDTWPWGYRASQRFSIAANVLTIELALENRSAARMPGGFGFHPFFPRPRSARMRAPARRLWQGAAQEFPTTCSAVPPGLDFGSSRAVRYALGLDHCYSGWSGSATIEWDDADARSRVELSAAPLEHLMVYVPADRDFFCVEPVSHAINAFNVPGSAEHAALSLEPGAQRAAAVTVRCEDTRR